MQEEQSDDPRVVQAKLLWDKGFGRELKKASFEEYLADIPEIPETLVPDDPRLGIAKSCKLLGIQFEENGWMDADVVPCDDRHATHELPFWVRMHDGRKNRNRKPSDCRKECVGNVYAGTAMVGIMTYAQFPEIVKEGEHILDLPGSVRRDDRGGCAFLKLWFGQVRLHVSRHDNALPDFGSGCFLRE